MSRVMPKYTAAKHFVPKPRKWDVDYISYEVVDVKESTGPGVNDFVVKQKTIEHKVNIDKFIESFKDSVGVENILKQVAKTGNTSLLAQDGAFIDVASVPELPQDKLAIMGKAKEAYGKIDPALTQGKSMEDFLKTLSMEDINSYIDKKIAEKAASSEKKEGN